MRIETRCAPKRKVTWDAKTMAEKQKAASGHCSAINCNNNRKKRPELSYFKFPRDKARCRDWVQRCRRADLMSKSTDHLHRNNRLCSLHFEDSQFMNAGQRNRLVWNALPSLFDVPNPPPTLTLKRPLPKRTPSVSVKKRKTTADRDADEEIRCKDSEGTSTHQPNAGPSSGDADEEFRCKECEGTSTHQPNAGPSSGDADAKKNTSEKDLKREKKRWQNKYYRERNKKRETPKKPKVCKKVSERKKKEELICQISQYLSGPALEFVSSRIHMGSKKKRRWLARDKSVALALFHASPKAYRLVKKIFALPSVATLRRTMARVQVYPGFNNNILSSLQQKLETMPQGSNLCSLVLDEMSIKEAMMYNVERDEVEGVEDFGEGDRTEYAANHATVFMLKGITHSWKQPIGYFLSSGPIEGKQLQKLMLEGLRRVKEKGLQVRVIIADQGSNKRCALETLLGATKDKPYIEVDGEHIFVMYDPPHLLKNIRNNLRNTGFTVDDEEVSWDHIVTFFKLDRKNKYKMAPKLTYRHIYMPPFAAMRVKYASQVLSHTVAAGLETLCHLNVLPPEAEKTATFVENFDRLFNTFNSTSFTSNQKMQNALQETSEHWVFLEEMLAWLETVNSKSKKQLPCLNGWIMDINDLVLLWKDLHNNHNVHSLFTQRLNQDCVENLFSVIRGSKGGNRANPNAREFRQAIRAAMVDAILLQGRGSNCHEDADKFLLTLTSFCDHQASANTLPEPKPRSVMDPVPFSEADYETQLTWLIANPPDPTEGTREDPVLCSTETAVLFYIAGYIARRVCEKTCQGCQDQLREVPSGAAHEIFLSHKHYDKLRGEGLIVPSQELFAVVQQLSSSYTSKVERCMYRRHVRATLGQELEADLVNKLCCPRPGGCPLQSLVTELFVKICLFSTLKNNSTQFSAPSQKRNRKMMKLSHV